MNLVFVNSFEKKLEEDRIVTAQVSIGEMQGVWHVLWNEPGKDGRGVQSTWFEGDKWQEMLAVFRAKLAEKAAEGFLPLIEAPYDQLEGVSDRSAFNRMLHYFSELHANEELLQKLKKWRREQAVREGKSAWTIATNRVLQMIACFVPHLTQELSFIPGFGENRCALYGKAIVEITSAYPRNGTFPLDWVAGQIDDYSFRLWLHRQKELKMKAQLERRAAKKKLVELISDGASLDEAVKIFNLPRRELVLWIEEMNAEGHDLERWIDSELQEMPEADRELAWKALESEGDRYLKPVLKKVYSDDQLKDKDVDRLYEWLRLMRMQFRKGAAEVKAG